MATRTSFEALIDSIGEIQRHCGKFHDFQFTMENIQVDPETGEFDVEVYKDVLTAADWKLCAIERLVKSAQGSLATARSEIE